MQEPLVNNRIRPFSYISDLFKYTEGFNLMGHQIGRKVGDMLELVVMAKIYEDEELAHRVVYEPKLLGATGAGHKVEFGFFEPDQSPVDGKPFGFIECKKVGVEVTKDSSTKDRHLSLEIGQEIKLGFSRTWMTTKLDFMMKVGAIKAQDVVIDVYGGGQHLKSVSLKTKERIKIVVSENGKLHILCPGDELRDVQDVVRIFKYITFEGVKDGITTWSLWDCLTGPQTIEKAKQASLVAMDVRKRVDGKWGRDDLDDSQKSLTTILVLTEASHWEEKSKKVITTCVDHNIIVPDEVIVEAFKLFEQSFGLEKMLSLIRKNEYLANKEVRQCLAILISKFNNKLFYDLNLSTYVDFKYKEGKLIVFTT